MDFSTSIITLFLVMDSIGNIPLLLALLKNVEPGRRYQVLVRELVFALLILVVFLLLGNKLLTFFGFSHEALSAAGASQGVVRRRGACCVSDFPSVNVTFTACSHRHARELQREELDPRVEPQEQ